MRVRSAPAALSVEDTPSSSGIGRRSFLRTGVGMLLSAPAFSAMAMSELSRERTQEDQKQSYALETIDDLRMVIRREFGNAIENAYAAGNIHDEETDAPAFSNVLTEKIMIEADRFCCDPVTSLDRSRSILRAVMDYVTHYRLSMEQCAQRSKLDCNDKANVACEILSGYGLPMHVISLMPKKLGHCLDYDWHQFAACRMNENRHLVFNWDEVTMWHGTLREYVTERSSPDVPMKIMPIIGISKYARPTYDWGISKLLLQIKHHIAHEEEMEVFSLENQSASIAQA